MATTVETERLKKAIEIAFDAVNRARDEAEAIEHAHKILGHSAFALNQSKWQLLEAEQFRKDYVQTQEAS